jgi:NitT/TauT family transport system substrate-binding protein
MTQTFPTPAVSARRGFGVCVWVWLTGALLALGCQAVMAQTLVIGTSRTAQSLPVYVAEAQNYFHAAGVDVRTRAYPSGVACLAALRDGQVQIATASEVAVMFSAFTRPDLAIFATLDNSTTSQKIVVRRDSSFRSAQQLLGERIATVANSTAVYYLDSTLLMNGIDPAQVAVQYLPPDKVGPALVAGDVDAAVIWEPYAHETLTALGKQGGLLPNAPVYTSRFNLVAARGPLAEREATFVKVLQAIERAMRFIAEHPAQAQAILQARLGVDPSYIADTWGDYQYVLSLNQSLVTSLDVEARWAVREGHARASGELPRGQDLVVTVPLRKVLPDSVTLFDTPSQPQGSVPPAP